MVDGPGAFRSAAWQFDDYSLETVSQTLLKRGKKIEHADERMGEIEHLYRNDSHALAAYNVEDARLVLALFDHAQLWHFLIQRSHLTGLSMDRAGASAAAFNTVYMPRLHRHKLVAPSVGEQPLQQHSPGGYVMDSLPGIYTHVIVLDFKSLYLFHYSNLFNRPYGAVLWIAIAHRADCKWFLAAQFHRTKHILPVLIDQLWAARDAAKQESNAALSQAIKIIMNSFYGVLGSDVCRFFDPRLASSITKRGHQILQESASYIEQQGYRVIYGDTDSLFVHIDQHDTPDTLGHQLAQSLNQWCVPDWRMNTT